MEYAEGLQELQEALSSDYLSTRMRRGVASVAQEFATFLSTRARPGRDTWDTCTDVEVLLFLQRQYLRQHTGRDGGAIAPSTLQTAVSHLAWSFFFFFFFPAIQTDWSLDGDPEVPCHARHKIK